MNARTTSIGAFNRREMGAAKPGATGLNGGSAPGGYPSAGASRVAGPLLVAAVLLQGACASLEGPDYAVQDPGEKFNRASFEFSEEVDRSFLVPVARTYQRVLPDPLERGASNFFANLRMVDSGLNGFLQGKPKSGSTDLMRFLLNSTLGVAGLFDVATPAGLRAQNEDFGQTLAVWGWRSSRYVYVPLVGPSTVRDLPAMALSAFAPRLLLGQYHRLWVSGVGLVGTRADALALTDVRDAAALDPYAFTREAYYQRREFLIHDGQPPLDDFDSFFNEADAGE